MLVTIPLYETTSRDLLQEKGCYNVLVIYIKYTRCRYKWGRVKLIQQASSVKVYSNITMLGGLLIVALRCRVRCVR